LSNDKTHKPDRDFVLIFGTDEIWKPKAVLSRSIQGKYAAMISFIPEFNQEELDDCKMAALKSNDFDADMDAAQGEFIFVLDRSGSMSGTRMKMANEALILFLKSLPQQCFFNIISFGSRYDYLFPKSVLATDQNIELTIKKVNAFTASYGGTEIN